MSWLTAYLLTQLVEVPIYLIGARRLRRGRRWLLAFGASTVTHPVVWFLFPWDNGPWIVSAVLSETFAFVTEAWSGSLAGVEKPWLWSLLANASSVCAGLVVQGGWSGF